MTSNETQNYFDLHVRGLGYVNRFRYVEAKQGRRFEPFYAVHICAMEGPSDAPNYLHLDVKVVGEKAIELLKDHEGDISNPDTKVLIGFNCGGLTVDPFTYQRGEKQGEKGYAVKTRLLRIAWMKIKRPGENAYATVYSATEEAPSDSEQPRIAA